MKKFYILLALLLPVLLISSSKKDDLIVDSAMTFEEAIAGTKAPQDIIEKLCIIDIVYYSTDNKLHKGQLVIAKEVRKEIEEIFQLALSLKFPINKAVPIVKYNWSDNASMDDNNTSAFNYRNIAGTDRLSRHALGMAVDINPMFNPVVENEEITPKGGKWDHNRAGTLTEDSPIVKKFIENGWTWGGNFQSFKDYHHFDKR